MQKEFTIGTETIRYTLKKSKRARRVRLAVSGDGSVTLTTPSFLGESIAEKFLWEKAEWVIEKLASFMPFRPRLVKKRRSRKEYKEYQERARQLVLDRMAHFNQWYQFSFGRISIRNQKTRWGSCSQAGNLSFNYRIALLPAALADYIIVHELCHLGELNHSARFWKLVAETLPDFRERRSALKQQSLHSV